MNSSVLLWLIALPLISAPLIYLAGRLQAATARPVAVAGYVAGIARPAPQNSMARWLGLVALLLTWIPLGLAVRRLSLSGPLSLSVGGVPLHLDGLSLLMIAVTLALGTAVALYSGPYLAGEVGEEKYYAMLVAMIGAIFGLACAGDLFNLWVWFETMAVSSYLLVAFYRERPASLEAGVKYLVQSATGSVLVVLGIALVLAQTGTLNLSQIQATALASPGLLAAGALFTIGFGVKIALVPLHTWLPDAHSQAPSGISAMLSGVVIEAGLLALLRALAALASVTLSWGVLLLAFGALNMAAGNLLALRQTEVKRLLAYSSLSHVGYMLLGVGIGLYAGQVAGAQGGLFHLLTHGLMKGLAFLAVGALLFALRAGNHNPLTIADMSGAARRYPLVALTLSVALLGLGGLPPLAGFMSKWQILVAGFLTHNPAIYALVGFAALNSVFSLAYYAPLVNAVYRQQPSMAVKRGEPLPKLMQAPLVLLAVIIVAAGIWPGLLTWLSEPAGTALLIMFGY